MRFGLCTGLQDADAALAAGFDYVELGASSLLENEDEYARLGVKVTNLFFPGRIKLFGPEAAPYMDYVHEVLAAAGRLGFDVMVIGSGGSRNAPEGVDPVEAERRFVKIVGEIAEAATPYGIVIAPESLNRTETNVGNDLGRLATALRAEGAGYTADSFHVLVEWNMDGHEEPPSAEHWAAQVPFLPTHVHLGDRTRIDPSPSDLDLLPFVARLNELGYDGRVSLECRRRDGNDLAAALRSVKELFGR